MIKPLALYIGLRYMRTKRRNRFISFISLASIVGIALGIIVLITVLSVINGFDEEIRNRFFAIAPQVTVTTNRDMGQNWTELVNEMRHIPQIQAAAPFISGQAVILNADTLRSVHVFGILPSQESQISQLADQVVLGNLNTLTPGSFNIMLGQTLASDLGLQLGDSVSVFVAQNSDDMLPQFDYQKMTVSAIFTSSQGFGFDQILGYIHRSDAQNLFTESQHWSGLNLKLDDLYQAGLVNQQLRAFLPFEYNITDWTQQFGSFFQTLAIQKTMLFVILLFIIGIAVFNLISTLIMVVNEKRADIAILRTLGATPLTIMNAFIIQGAFIGLIGTFLGLFGGILLAANITTLVDFIQKTFHLQLISESVYFVNFLPSKIMLADVIKVCTTAFGLSVLATIYPALVAFRMQPAEVLRSE